MQQGEPGRRPGFGRTYRDGRCGRTSAIARSVPNDRQSDVGPDTVIRAGRGVRLSASQICSWRSYALGLGGPHRRRRTQEAAEFKRRHQARGNGAHITRKTMFTSTLPTTCRDLCYLTCEALAETERSGERPLAFMLRVMRDESQDDKCRDVMALAAAPFVRHKLSAIAYQLHLDLRDRSDEQVKLARDALMAAQQMKPRTPKR